MRKYVALFSILILALLLSGCNVTFDGYYYNLDDARAAEKIYSEYDNIFTAKYEDKIVDFVICGDIMRISKIDCRGEGEKTQYNIKSTSSYIIAEHIAEFNSDNDYHWTMTGNFCVQVEFAIVTKEFNASRDNYECFEFVYEDTTYCLCYKIYEA